MARKTVSWERYYANHQVAPEGSGRWIFRQFNGTEWTFTGSYQTALAFLPEGTWTLMP